jgi:hypothetical protein
MREMKIAVTPSREFTDFQNAEFPNRQQIINYSKYPDKATYVFNKAGISTVAELIAHHFL